jgi:hypothetical protein
MGSPLSIFREVSVNTLFGRDRERLLGLWATYVPTVAEEQFLSGVEWSATARGLGVPGRF